MDERERRIAAAARTHLARIGLNYRPAVMILYCMAAEGYDYRHCLEEWAAYEDTPTWTPDRWHSEMCYMLLKSKAEVVGGVAAWFEEQAKEVRRLAH